MKERNNSRTNEMTD